MHLWVPGITIREVIDTDPITKKADSFLPPFLPKKIVYSGSFYFKRSEKLRGEGVWEKHFKRLFSSTGSPQTYNKHNGS